MIKKLAASDMYQGDLILVNAEFPYRRSGFPAHLFPIAYEDTETDRSASEDRARQYRETCMVDRKVSSLLSSLLQKNKAGSQILAVSGYRSVAEQTRLYEDSLTQNGEAFTKQYVAKPEHSEHHTGLAVDLAIHTEKIDDICPEFPQEGIAGEFRKLAPEYGFIERYRQGKEKITGISAEPWHFRFVGYPHSEIMQEKNLSLEEYIEFIKGFPYPNQSLLRKRKGYRIAISYLPMNQSEILLEISEDKDCEISGNNVDGFILTVWERERNEK